MPTYEYACRGCGQHIEVVQSFRDDPLAECGSCGGALRKVFSAAGIIFKGSGYYVTDTRAAASTNGAGKTSSPGSAGTSEGGSDSAGSDNAGSDSGSSDGASSTSDSKSDSPAEKSA